MPENALYAAVLAVQQEVPALKKTATNPHYKSRYVPLDEIVETVNPVLHKHGLIWTASPSANEHGPSLKYKLAHVKSGEAEEGEMSLLLSKQDAQGQGSAITYARRYALCAVLNLVAEDDDDGHRAAAGRQSSSEPNGRPGKPSDKQVDLINSLGKQKKPTVAQLKVMLAEVGVDSWDDFDEGWPSRVPFTGGREGTASAFIDRLGKPLPKVESAPTPPSDVLGAGEGEFEHKPESLEGTPWETN